MMTYDIIDRKSFELPIMSEYNFFSILPSLVACGDSKHLRIMQCQIV